MSVLCGENGRKARDGEQSQRDQRENQQAYQCIRPSVIAGKTDRNIKSTE